MLGLTLTWFQFFILVILLTFSFVAGSFCTVNLKCVKIDESEGKKIKKDGK